MFYPKFMQKFERGKMAYSREVMYWAGYTYRYWHYYTGESSKEIYRIADAETMNDCWLGFHTMDVEMAIEDLKEIDRQKAAVRSQQISPN